MSAPGFGFSVGDFIAVIQLVIQGYEALQDAGGAASDFQQHVAWLESVVPVLAKLESIPLDGFEDIVKACNGPLLAFQNKITKYEKYLKPQELATSGTNARVIFAFKTAPAKLRWAIKVGKAVKELRVGIGDNISVMNSKLGLQTLDTSKLLQQKVEQIDIKQNDLDNKVTEVVRQLNEFQPIIQNALPAAIEGMRSDVNVARSASTAAINAVLSETERINQGLSLLNEICTTKSAALLQELELQREHFESARVEQMNKWEKARTKIDRLQIPNIQRPLADTPIQLEQMCDHLVIFNRQKLLSNKSITVQAGHLEVIGLEVLEMILEFAQYLARGIRQLLIALWLMYPALRRFFIAMGSITLQPLTLRENSIRFEDVLGRVRYLPYQQFKYWEVFTTMLRCDFKGLPGEREVIQGLYRITAFKSKLLIIDQNSWNDRVLPGSKISMTVVLDEYKVPADRCPGCGTILESIYGFSDTDGYSQYVKCHNCAFILSRKLIKSYTWPELKPSNPETPSPIESLDPKFPTPSPILATEGQRASTSSEPTEANEAIKVFRRIHVIAKGVYVLDTLKSILKSRSSRTIKIEGSIYVFRNPAYANALKIGHTARNVTSRLAEHKVRCMFHPILVFKQQSHDARNLERLCMRNLVLERRVQKICRGCHGTHREYFEADERLVHTVISRWNRWLEKYPYDEGGALNAYWMSRIFGPDSPRTLEELYDVIDRG